MSEEPQKKTMKIVERCSGTPSTSASKILPPSSLDTTTSIVMNTCYQDFSQIRNLPGFVDKSLLIEAILKQVEGILLIAPRRFGKSVNLSMLKRFFEMLPDAEAIQQNRRLFHGLQIENENCASIIKDHFGKYPIIYLDFRSPGSVRSYNKAFELVRSCVHKAYQSHAYLSSSDKLIASEKKSVERWCDDDEFTSAKSDIEISIGITNLAEYLVKHFNKKVLVLVDEYDSICSDAIIYAKDVVHEKTGRVISTAENEIKNVIACCVDGLLHLLKGNENVSRVILTGISYLATMGLSKLNNITTFKFQENYAFSKFYGLTFDELRDLLRKVDDESKFDELVEYYNGYRNNMISIWSIMEYLNSVPKSMKNYWQASGIACCLAEVLKITNFRDVINKLLSDVGNEVEFDLFNNIGYEHISALRKMIDKPKHNIQTLRIYLNVLLEQGYLAISSISGREVVVRIPNREIKDEFYQKMKLFYQNIYYVDFNLIMECASIFDKICTSDDQNKQHLTELCNKLNTLFRDIVFDVKNEATVQHIIFLIIFSSKAQCFSEDRNPMRTRLDLLAIIGTLGIIIELKYDKTARDGLEQILRKQYFQAFENEKYNPNKVEIDYFLLIGLNMSVNQEITLSVLINNVDINEECCFPRN